MSAKPTEFNGSTPKMVAVFKKVLDITPRDRLQDAILKAAKHSGVGPMLWDLLTMDIGNGGKKEIVAKWQTCRHCKAGFDLTANADGCCSWHDGKMRIFFKYI